MRKYFWILLLVPNLGHPIDYQVHVTYPLSAPKPGWKTVLYDTNKHVKSHKIDLYKSKYECVSIVFSLELRGQKIYSIGIRCKIKGGKDSDAFDAWGTCTEEKFQMEAGVQITLHEASPIKLTDGVGGWEHQVSIECSPGKPSLLENLIKDQSSLRDRLLKDQ